MTETKRARAAFNAAYNTIESTEAEFKKVAQILASASDIGVKHSLWKEWNDLRKLWQQTIQDSRINARQCATLMQDQALLFSTIAISNLSLEEKQRVIGVFLEEIPTHMRDARDIAGRFNDIRTQIEGFHSKVENTMKENAKISIKGFLQNAWQTVKKCCAWIAEQVAALVQPVLETLYRAFNGKISFEPFDFEIDLYNLLKRCRNFRYNCERTWRSHPLDQDESDCIGDITDHLTDNLSRQEQVWQLVEQFCITLRDQFERAEGLRAQGFKLCDPILLSTHPKFTMLVECLQAYAEGVRI